MSVSRLQDEPVNEEAPEALSVLPKQLTLSPRLVMLSDPSGNEAESIRQLRTRVIAQHLDHGRRALALCSPSLGSGCSSIAANLALAFAQAGYSVLLLNADMREEGADEMFGLQGSDRGLKQYLSQANLNFDAVINPVLPTLSVIPSGGISEDAQELLSSARFEALVHTSLREFDLTIVDTPPANRYADAQRVASLVGYAAVVARTHKTYFSDVSELVRQLAADRVTIVGSVLNEA